VEATRQIEEKRKKPKPEEQEGMPQRRHCPGNSNPKSVFYGKQSNPPEKNK
jgi:hypothetical protein